MNSTSIQHRALYGVKRTNLQSDSLFRLKLIQKLNQKLRIPWNIVNHRNLHRRRPLSPFTLSFDAADRVQRPGESNKGKTLGERVN